MSSTWRLLISPPAMGRRNMAIDEAILEAVAAALTVVGHSDRLNPAFFEVPSAYEITVGGKKLVGSAQLRRRGAILQHGSLPLTGHIGRVVRGLRYRDEDSRGQAASRLRRHATPLEVQLGRPISFDAAAGALVEGFVEALGWSISPGPLTASEQSMARQLEATLYRQVDLAPAAPEPGAGRSA